MFRNYLLVTFRNLIKNRVFTLINILGLGVALLVCIVAFFNHMFNYEFDRTHLNFDKIYRVNSFRDMEGREQEYGIIPATLGLELKKDIPGIEKAAIVFIARRVPRICSVVTMVCLAFSCWVIVPCSAIFSRIWGGRIQ